MSKIIFDPEEGSYSSYSLENFTGIVEEEEKKKRNLEKEFQPDRKKAAGERDFVLGGFDFEYGGGYRQDEIMKKTTDEIEGMIREAREKAEQIEKEAFEKGRREGYQKGSTDGLKQATSLMQSLLEAVQSIMNIRHDFFQTAENEMVDLVALASAEIVYREIKQDKNIILDVIRNAVRDIHSKQFLHIRLNPVDVEMVATLKGELVQEVDKVEGVDFKGDPSITSGGCVIETNIGQLDATVEARLKQVYEKISGKVGY